MDLIFAAFFALLALAVGFFAAAIPQGDRRWWALAAILFALVVTSRLVGESWAGVLLLDAAELVGVALIWARGTPEARHAARAYLYAIVPASVAIAVAMLLVDRGGLEASSTAARLAVGLLVVGFALKLGMIPFYYWLPRVATAAAPMTSALIIGVVGIATVTELAGLRDSAPWVFSDYAMLWLVVALLSSLGGAILALAQTSIRRMLAFSSVDDLGYLVLGLVVGTNVGIAGVWLGALSHALAKVILFGAVALAEQGTGGEITLSTRGLAARFPLAGGAFIAGALAFLGAPPALGFAGHWRLYLVGAEYGGPALLLTMLAATALTTLCYVRVIHSVWLGPVPDADVVATAPRRGASRTRLGGVVLVVLAVALVLLGAYPDALLQLDGSLGALAVGG